MTGKTTALPKEPLPAGSEMESLQESLQKVPIGASDPEALSRLLRYTLPSLAVVGGLSALDHLRNRYQSSQMFVPTRYPAGIWDPSIYGLPYQDVWFESEDGVLLHGWWIEHPKARATLLYCHGNSGCIVDRIGVFRQLRRLRVNLFVFDYRGYGRSAGQPSEKGLFADVRAASDWIAEERGIDLGQVILFGHSMGGAVAIDGALHRPFAGLVVQSSFTQMRDMARFRYPNLPMYWIARNAFRSIDKVAHLRMPKLFVHGTDDETVPFAMGERLHGEARGQKLWYPVPRANHNDVPRFGGLRYLNTLSRFVRDCLRERPAGNA